LTLAATDISETDATLNGAANPGDDLPDKAKRLGDDRVSGTRPARS